MAIPEEHEALFADTARRGTAIYEELKAVLEPEHNGRAIAIHVDTGEYAIASTQAGARREMHERRPEGLLFSRTIGPPTERDYALMYRLLAGEGQEPYASYFAAGKRRTETPDS